MIKDLGKLCHFLKIIFKDLDKLLPKIFDKEVIMFLYQTSEIFWNK